MVALGRVARQARSGIDPGVPFTRAVALRPVVAVLDGCGAHVDDHLIAARIDPAILDRPNAPIPLAFAIDFLERASRAEGIEDVGLMAAGRVNGLTDLGAFSTMLSDVPSVGAYLTRGARLITRLTSGSRYELRRAAGGFRFHMAQPHPGGRVNAQAELFSVLVTIRTLERLTGRPWRPASLRVPPWCRIGAAGRNRLAIERIEHNGDDFSFPVDPWLLPLAVSSAGREPAPSCSLAEHPADLAGGIAAVLDLFRDRDDVSLSLVAEAAGSSVRTLQRRLRAERTSFAHIQRDWRLRRATRLLLETDASIAEIAMGLGYDDASNFARGFRAYAGCSPTAFRAANVEFAFDRLREHQVVGISGVRAGAQK